MESKTSTTQAEFHCRLPRKYTDIEDKIIYDHPLVLDIYNQLNVAFVRKETKKKNLPEDVQMCKADQE